MPLFAGNRVRSVQSDHCWTPCGVRQLLVDGIPRIPTNQRASHVPLGTCRNGRSYPHGGNRFLLHTQVTEYVLIRRIVSIHVIVRLA